MHFSPPFPIGHDLKRQQERATQPKTEKEKQGLIADLRQKLVRTYTHTHTWAKGKVEIKLGGWSEGSVIVSVMTGSTEIANCIAILFTLLPKRQKASPYIGPWL